MIGPGQIGPQRRGHHDLPARLAVADQAGASLGLRLGAITASMKIASALQTSSIVWPGIGSGRKPTK